MEWYGLCLNIKRQISMTRLTFLPTYIFLKHDVSCVKTTMPIPPRSIDRYAVKLNKQASTICRIIHYPPSFIMTSFMVHIHFSPIAQQFTVFLHTYHSASHHCSFWTVVNQFLIMLGHFSSKHASSLLNQTSCMLIMVSILGWITKKSDPYIFCFSALSINLRWGPSSILLQNISHHNIFMSSTRGLKMPLNRRLSSARTDTLCICLGLYASRRYGYK